ncbi:hypothetical protein [Rhodomicrobium vannielii]|uniref:hypothetical protein n=1 Tax=Rhodomicrobium vannielii TaxID=1069 RepID=UPI0001C24593|nr:hypothetical protein [Rhodomicrobium vannielii]
MPVVKKERQRVRNFNGLAEYQAKKAHDGDIHVMEFDGKPIRAIYHGGDLHFAVVDVVGVLSDSADPANYWRVMKARLRTEGASQTITECNGFKLPV